MNFNDKIDLFMKNNNYKNLKQLASECDIPYTTLRDFYEKKSADNSRLSTIRKLATFMKCSMDYLTYDDLTEPSQIKIDGLDLSNLQEIDNGQNCKEEFDFGDIKVTLSKNGKITDKDILEMNQFLMEEKIKGNLDE
ncbi:MAG: hypothetical protein V8Q71_00015 [Bacilli bacterium]